MNEMHALPFVTVVMPVYNEAAFIDRALGAVINQDYPAKRMEVLVVDGLSTDDTVARVHALASADARVRVLANPGRIQSQAMNIGFRAAQGDVIIRVDGHCVIEPDYVSRCVETLERTGAVNVGGPQRFVGESPLGRALAAAYRSPFGVPSKFTTGQYEGVVDTVYLGAWPRAALERVGGFDETLAVNEDYELNYRLRQAGGQIYLTPDIRSSYYGRQSWGALWQQFHRYGRWKFIVLARHPASAHLRHLVAPGFVAALVLGACVSPMSRLLRRLWYAVLASYGLATGIASLNQAVREGWSLMLRLPVVFACMHIAWGSGFWRQAIQWGIAVLRGTRA